MKRILWSFFVSVMLFHGGKAMAQHGETVSYHAFETDTIRNQLLEQGFNETGESEKRWSVMFQLGGAGGGPFREIESAMRRNGFGATSPGGCFFIFCSQPRAHPYSNNGGLIWAATVTRHIRNSYSASLNYSSYMFAETYGYHSLAGDLTIRYSAATIAALFHVGAHDLFSVGLGPVLSFTSTGNSIESSKKTKTGFAFDIALKVPRRTTVYGALNFQYKWIPNVEVGPFTVHSLSSSATLPKTKINYDHSSLGLALGFRF